jgi:hypothetical protein
LGMMPHPERMADKILSGEDGLGLFLSLMNWYDGYKRSNRVSRFKTKWI